MSVFQLIMLGASAYFAWKVYEHIQTLQDPEEKKIKKAKPADVLSLIDEADKSREAGEHNKALAIYSEAKKLEPKSAEVLFKMGYTMKELDRLDEAKEYFLESLKYDEQNPFAYLELSRVYKKLGDEEKAQQNYNKAVELDEDIRDL